MINHFETQVNVFFWALLHHVKYFKENKWAINELVENYFLRKDTDKYNIAFIIWKWLLQR